MRRHALAQVSELLKDHGADVAAREKDNITALMEAALAGHGDVVDVLVDADGGALVGATSNTGVSARAGKGCEIPNFKGSYLGRFPLVWADFWTSDHLSERSRP